MRAHPAADLFPMMTDGELATLARDIVNHGQHHPILVIDGGGEWLILDGRNRFEACRRVGVHPKTSVWTGDDPIAAVWSLNCERRHLSESQRAMIGEGFATMKHGTNQHRKEEGPAGPSTSVGASQGSAAKLVGVSVRLIKRAHFVHHSMAPYRIRPKVMANVISDTQVTAETWASWTRRVDQKWPGASREEKDQLIEQLEACRRSAAAFIRELKKEARTEGETA